MFDVGHSNTEDRWVGLGVAANGNVLVVVYTWNEIGPADAAVRIISARKAVTAEIRNYEENQ